ncbi:hypothetical protein DL771_003328 [Monosporascus sp. 5C6A]|nr:hypothetical protein DL771_003328 [Monosporascus sp. 5C6A]
MGLRGNRNHVNSSFTWNAMEISASSCYCCAIILSGCRGCFRQHGISESDILEGSLYFCYPPWVEDAANRDADKELVFRMVGGRRTSPRSNSGTALATIKGWISGCIVTHDLCNSPESPHLPTRVVDVGLDDGIVKLVESKGAKGRYICLSHCWGANQIITTERRTLQERKKGIPWKDLSRTFQDAILLTRTLGFRFIWIDSLCILQDDLEDWEIESAKMASVYSNGHLTIAATHSGDGRGGLFLRTEDFQVSGKTPGGEDYCLYFRQRIDHHLEVVSGDEIAWGTGNATAVHYPLLTRAWVYQERMLSTRVVHFGRYEIFFECQSSIQCECEGIAYHGSSMEAPIALMKVEHAAALQAYDDFGELYLRKVSYQRARLWRTMVCSYTALLLTKSKDRLPAFGGLAKNMAPWRKQRYLAGLWEETLNDDLLWFIETSKGKKARPYPRTAPTWSWASVEAYVRYWDVILYRDISNPDFTEERPPYEHFSNVEKCEVAWTAVDEFGFIAHGSLAISGLVVKGVLERHVEIHGGIESIAYYVRIRDIRLEVKTDYLLDLGGIEVLCLRMSRIQEGRTDFLISLVLKESLSSYGCLERIGIFHIAARPPPVDCIGELFRNAKQQTITIV